MLLDEEKDLPDKDIREISCIRKGLYCSNL